MGAGPGSIQETMPRNAKVGAIRISNRGRRNVNGKISVAAAPHALVNNGYFCDTRPTVNAMATFTPTWHMQETQRSLSPLKQEVGATMLCPFIVASNVTTFAQRVRIGAIRIFKSGRRNALGRTAVTAALHAVCVVGFSFISALFSARVVLCDRSLPSSAARFCCTCD